jgi:hypothetical protein
MIREEIDFVICFARDLDSDFHPNGFRIWEFLVCASHPDASLEFIADFAGSSTVHAMLVERGPQGRGILRSGRLRTIRGSYARTVDAIFSELALWPGYVIDAWAAGIAPTIRPVANPGFKPAGGKHPMLLLGIQARDWLRQWVDRLLFEERWNIGIVKARIESILDGPLPDDVRWFPTGQTRAFVADPFGWVEQGRITAFFEVYDYKQRKGQIWSAEVGHDGWAGPLRLAISLPHHMSFPNLLRVNGLLHCLPETYEANEVALYRALTFPDVWEKAATLLPATPGIDAVVVEHQDLWWLFCTLKDGSENYKLYLWYAHDLFGDWKAHPLNPVKIDVCSSRNAGAPFTHEGYLFRLGQDCSESYGCAVTVNRITEMSPCAFTEETIIRVTPPKQSPNRRGLHTISPIGDCCLIDGKRRYLTARGLKYQVCRPFNRLRRILKV